MSSLSHELSITDPGLFKTRLLDGLGSVSIFGALVAEEAGANPNNLTLDPTTWASRTDGSKDIQLGTKPMDAAMRARLLFQDRRFDYADEVSYRLIHELMHPLLASHQHHPNVQALTNAAASIRGVSSGQTGLTTLGSLPHYRGDTKITEDVTELMTMYAWNPEYLRDFTDFLADPNHTVARQSLGLTTLSEGDTLFDIASTATAATLV